MHHLFQLAFRLHCLEKRAPFLVQVAPLCRSLHVFVALLKWTDKMINVFVLSVWVLYLCVL